METAEEEAVAAEVAEDVEAVAEGAEVAGDVDEVSRFGDRLEDIRDATTQMCWGKDRSTQNQRAWKLEEPLRERTARIKRQHEARQDGYQISDDCADGIACMAFGSSGLVQKLHLERRMIPL